MRTIAIRVRELARTSIRRLPGWHRWIVCAIALVYVYGVYDFHWSPGWGTGSFALAIVPLIILAVHVIYPTLLGWALSTLVSSTLSLLFLVTGLEALIYDNWYVVVELWPLIILTILALGLWVARPWKQFKVDRPESGGNHRKRRWVLYSVALSLIAIVFIALVSVYGETDRYYAGGGWTNQVLVLYPACWYKNTVQSKFVGQRFEIGKCLQAGDTLLFRPVLGGGAPAAYFETHGILGVRLDTLVITKWGFREYLIPPRHGLALVHEINSGREPRAEPGGGYFLRNRHWFKPAGIRPPVKSRDTELHLQAPFNSAVTEKKDSLIVRFSVSDAALMPGTHVFVRKSVSGHTFDCPATVVSVDEVVATALLDASSTWDYCDDIRTGDTVSSRRADGWGGYDWNLEEVALIDPKPRVFVEAAQLAVRQALTPIGESIRDYQEEFGAWPDEPRALLTDSYGLERPRGYWTATITYSDADRVVIRIRLDGSSLPAQTVTLDDNITLNALVTEVDAALHFKTDITDHWVSIIGAQVYFPEHELVQPLRTIY